MRSENPTTWIQSLFCVCLSLFSNLAVLLIWTAAETKQNNQTTANILSNINTF